jgi:hypothetical protein
VCLITIYPVWVADFETPASKFYVLFISAKSTEEEKEKKCCYLLVF